ncbi:hypothetical protein Patl1_37075 [Pistacia atlantica]|nr:hypothetical protein Patl1_37075 [Pistacia atlantica]
MIGFWLEEKKKKFWVIFFWLICGWILWLVVFFWFQVAARSDGSRVLGGVWARFCGVVVVFGLEICVLVNND